MYEGIGKREQDKARRIINKALEHGFYVSVVDDEDKSGYALLHSRDSAAIMDAIGNMDMDQLVLHTADGVRYGWIMLVWGNAEDGSELAADYSGPPTVDQIVSA